MKWYVLVGLIGLLMLLIFENKHIQVTRTSFLNPKIPAGFDGFVICQISDLHNTEFGKAQKTLLAEVAATKPDIIVITGDLVDRRRYNLETAMDFINGAVKIAPVYYVSGNHEAWSGNYADIKKRLLAAGTVVLDGERVSLSAGSDQIELLGLADPGFRPRLSSGQANTIQMEAQLSDWSTSQNFKILLTHRPELFDLYAAHRVDLIFSGHAHGGQVRLPFIGGLIAPEQGLFPRYTSGLYLKESSAMYVSRGLGNSVIPLRIFNRPEVAVVTLHKK